MGVRSNTRTRPRHHRRGFFVAQRNALEPLLNSRFKVFYKGELRMPESKRAWTEDDIAKLKAREGTRGADSRRAWPHLCSCDNASFEVRALAAH
jgi:hypothetical protein